MKIIQTFWTGPSGSADENLAGMKAGWLSCEYHWMSWALSCLQAKNIFGEVNLVTDLKGKQILADQLQLPYSNVSVGLEGVLDNYHPDLWALAKIYTYSIQTEPFLHLDGDVFMWQKPDENLLNSRLIAQNLDKNLGLYLRTLTEINSHFTWIPPSMLKANYEGKDIFASNAGLLGGNDTDFFDLYCRQAFKFIDENKNNLDKVNIGNLNFIFEQYLFCQLAACENIPVNYYKGMVDNPVFKDYIKFEDYPHVQMAHPVGGFKKYPHVCEHVAKRLRNDYPEYYYRIINMLCSAGIVMRSAAYHSSSFKLEQLLPPAERPIITDVEPSFTRTIAAIDYLDKKYKFNKLSALKVDADQQEFIKQTELILPDKAKRNCLLEIFKLAAAANSLQKKLYANPGGITALYNRDIKNYKSIQEVLSLPANELLKIKIGPPKHCKLLRTGWNWRLDYKEQVTTLMERNFNEKKSRGHVLLLPDELRSSIKEYYLDELDMIIFDIVKNNLTIDGLLSEIKQYFSPEEIEADPQLFNQLTTSAIKRLLYAGVVKVLT